MSEAQLPPVPDGFHWKVERRQEYGDWYSFDYMTVALIETYRKRTLFGFKDKTRTINYKSIEWGYFIKLNDRERVKAIAEMAQEVLDDLNNATASKALLGNYPPKRLPGA